MTSSPVSRVVYNGKRNSSPRSPSNSSEIFTPAHEENVRFIYEAWQCVERDLRNQMSGSERGLVEEYVEKVPNPSLKSECPWKDMGRLLSPSFPSELMRALATRYRARKEILEEVLASSFRDLVEGDRLNLPTGASLETGFIQK
ncbi:mapk-regulated corepressor-interacting protein 1 isoform X2 [Monodelphis domestica]|uniref:mapk-regulated corepressor-interacting protein 1 isoform X2 n=1 Tax=Monodelphis domestica TaxID=13616 RepID=UPI0024E1B099|nr:mapk-regulated corepressor-interacting protein 1 isoform X2 [Monodelphis domestica]XP_056673313.1 mapk-regulated corepressor-interacting protein 1 isoform X2 [Monodelphis domestica]